MSFSTVRKNQKDRNTNRGISSGARCEGKARRQTHLDYRRVRRLLHGQVQPEHWRTANSQARLGTPAGQPAHTHTHEYTADIVSNTVAGSKITFLYPRHRVRRPCEAKCSKCSTVAVRENEPPKETRGSITSSAPVTGSTEMQTIARDAGRNHSSESGYL